MSVIFQDMYLPFLSCPHRRSSTGVEDKWQHDLFLANNDGERGTRTAKEAIDGKVERRNKPLFYSAIRLIAVSNECESF